MSAASPPKILSAEAASRLAEADAVLRNADSTAFPVAQRVLKRVIIQDLGLTGLGLNVPHRKSWLLSGGRAHQLLEPDELGLPDNVALPEQLILVTRPEDDELERMSLEELQLRYWRLLFHARVHRELDQALASRRLSDTAVRGHIDELGQVAFDEIEDMLQREKYLSPDDTRTMVFVEFAAVFLELLYFSPDWLSSYFPCLEHPAEVEGMLTAYVPAPRLIEQTRLEGAPSVPYSRAADEGDSAFDWWKSDSAGERQHPRAYHRHEARARKASSRGNNVRAARVWLQAAQCAPDLLSGDAILGARREIEALARRLQAALGFDHAEAHDWLESLTALLGEARPGFWNPDARLLYDLQKVALDHERDVFVVDSFSWLKSFGKRPLRRKLPYQREVMMCRHLHSAIRRLTSSKLVGPVRAQLSHLLHRASELAEQQLRQRLEPLLMQAVQNVDLAPRNLLERVARKKVVQECLDVISERGFLNMGHLRDAISRNQLKLRDLTDRDLITGGPLLLLDKQCAALMDGVYQRGEFYLRWLQRLSGAVFGTPFGRWLTLFVLLPFGGAYVTLEGLNHLWHVLENLFDSLPHLQLISKETPVQSAAALAIVGGFFLGLIHSRSLRGAVLSLLSFIWGVLKGAVFDLPSRLIRQPAVRTFLRSMPIVMFRRTLLFPLFVTGLVWLLLPGNSWTTAYRWQLITTLFLASIVILNSRLGRSVEATTAEWYERTWYTVRVRIFVALFEGIMDFFKRVTEWIERVLYAVDEWLRFKTGESQLVLGVKAVIGIVWTLVAYVIRFCVTLLIEPQINPIKHFPVVTVSHKIILPMQPLLAKLLTPTLGVAWGNTVAGAIIFGTPGIFGFLVWELKENWRLYAANRDANLGPAPISTHGETVVRLVRPGFHSGTLPKLFGRLRKACRKLNPASRRAAFARSHEQLHHVEEAFRNFLERELIELLIEAGEFSREELTTDELRLTANSIRWGLAWTRSPESPVRITFAEQSGFLVAGLDDAGWLDQLDRERRTRCDRALAGIYALSGVDLVREHVASALHHRFRTYDISDAGLIVWPDQNFDTEVVYHFTDARTLSPRPARVAERYQLPRIAAEDVFFSRTGIHWSDWVAAWPTPTDAEMVTGDPSAIPMVLPRPT